MYEEDKKGARLEVILNQDDKGVKDATGILSKIFRQVLADLGIIPMRWNVLMESYLNNPTNRVPRSSKGRSSARGNLSKEILKSNMTWKNFEKAIKFLNPIKAEFSIKLHWKNGRVTNHHVVVGETDVSDEDDD